MTTTNSVRSSGWSEAVHHLAAGTAIGFLALIPFGLVVTRGGVSTESGLAGLILAALAGLLIGNARVGWLALIFGFVAAVAAGALPYLLVGLAFGWADEGIEAIIGYGPAIVSAAAVALAGTLVGRRYPPRVHLDSARLVVAGVIALVVWLAAWIGLYVVFGGRTV